MAYGAIVIFIVAALLQGRIEPFDRMLGPGYTVVANGGVYGIVIDERFGPRFFSENRRETIDGYWTPSRDDIALAEALIRKKRPDDGIEARERTIANRPMRDRGATIDALVSRQYVGITVDGVDLIVVIGFCHGGLPNYPLHRLIVLDGGECYWNAVINVDTGKMDRYVENGPG